MMAALLLMILCISTFGFLGILFADIVASVAASGSLLRYQAVTVIVTLFAPVAVASTVCTVVFLLAGDYIGAAFALLRLVLNYRHWKRLRSDDNWWKGRGKKILGSINRAFDKQAPTAAGAGA
ncbi:hypothetical protein [Arthrobacter sp. A2-55]|uniref:hypothetical protein n=1 Tax=Arthrobacter sp. A2-55 TaxID=2897337 RepID=UPI0021CD3F33|nr:hypothetical protein [Arthrobacter sp. A2-55]MCU6481313.1 hypothetical protein [Arthrobacter sp. A2-55]